MWISVNGAKVIEIDDSVVRMLLSLYPEENLLERPVFTDALKNDQIDLRKLKSEADMILVPWQMFLLTSKVLKEQLLHIERQREIKLTGKIAGKRKGQGNTTSKRILDRMIRLQNFTVAKIASSPNAFCQSLLNMSYKGGSDHIASHFGIDRDKLWRFDTKEKALDYLIKQVEGRSFNVSRGVLTHKFLPHTSVVNGAVYKATSGFILHDNCIPFIFLPGEINPNEVTSRQIYSLIYLLVVAGLGDYTYSIEKDFRALQATKPALKKIHGIVTEFLYPNSHSDSLRGVNIDSSQVRQITEKYKMSPTAILTTLKLRGVIDQATFEELSPDPLPSLPPSTKRSPHVSTAARKLCGLQGHTAVSNAVRSSQIAPAQAQYLLFGAINKTAFRKYRAEITL